MIRHYRDNLNDTDIVLILSENGLKQTIYTNDDKTIVFIVNKAEFDLKISQLEKVLEANKGKTLNNQKL